MRQNRSRAVRARSIAAGVRAPVWLQNSPSRTVAFSREMMVKLGIRGLMRTTTMWRELLPTSMAARTGAAQDSEREAGLVSETGEAEVTERSVKSVGEEIMARVRGSTPLGYCVLSPLVPGRVVR